LQNLPVLEDAHRSGLSNDSTNNGLRLSYVSSDSIIAAENEQEADLGGVGDDRIAIRQLARLFQGGIEQAVSYT
jgi:hypothetical protein